MFRATFPFYAFFNLLVAVRLRVSLSTARAGSLFQVNPLAFVASRLLILFSAFSLLLNKEISKRKRFFGWRLSRVSGSVFDRFQSCCSVQNACVSKSLKQQRTPLTKCIKGNVQTNSYELENHKKR